jgi:hypothetical protein
MFSAMDVNILAKHSSDHHPILVTLKEKRGLVWHKKKLFCMEDGWCAKEDYRRAT